MATTKAQQDGRRGPYRQRASNLLDAGEAAYHQRVAELAERYSRPLLDRMAVQSEARKAHGKLPLDTAGVESAALQLARLEVHHQVFAEMQAKKRLTSDEARALSGLSREIRAVRAELGLPLLRAKDGSVVIDDDYEFDDE